jgi:hypothetical protein
LVPASNVHSKVLSLLLLLPLPLPLPLLLLLTSLLLLLCSQADAALGGENNIPGLLSCIYAHIFWLNCAPVSSAAGACATATADLLG